MGHWYNPDKSGQYSEYPKPGWLPSVSTILAATNFVRQQSFAKAALKNPYKTQQRKEQTADRGVTVHSWISAFLQQAPLPEVRLEHQPYTYRIQPWLEAIVALSQEIRSEFPVYHDDFAGMVDLFTLDSVNDGRTLVDFKTKDRPVLPEALHEGALQLTGYAEAFHHEYGLPINNVVVVCVYPSHVQSHRFAPENLLEEWRNRRRGYCFAQSAVG